MQEPDAISDREFGSSDDEGLKPEVEKTAEEVVERKEVKHPRYESSME